MKRHLPWLAFASFCVFGAVLLFRIAAEKPVHVIHQKSKYMVVDVSDPELAEAFANGEIVIKSDDPYAKTLVRVNSGNPTHIRGKLKGDGQILVINPAGIIVGPGDASTKAGETSPAGAVVRSTLESDTIIQGRAIGEGNVYALAIEEQGTIRASRPITIPSSKENRKE